jgi:hypothetical protein
VVKGRYFFDGSFSMLMATGPDDVQQEGAGRLVTGDALFVDATLKAVVMDCNDC